MFILCLCFPEPPDVQNELNHFPVYDVEAAQRIDLPPTHQIQSYFYHHFGKRRAAITEMRMAIITVLYTETLLKSSLSFPKYSTVFLAVFFVQFLHFFLFLTTILFTGFICV